jgi:acyl carrier protein
MFLRWRSVRSRGGNPPRANRRAEIRGLIVAAVLQNPLAVLAEPDVIERMSAGDDVAFLELGFDSLALLTLATDLCDHDFMVSEVDILSAATVDGLAELIGKME